MTGLVILYGPEDLGCSDSECPCSGDGASRVEGSEDPEELSVSHDLQHFLRLAADQDLVVRISNTNVYVTDAYLGRNGELVLQTEKQLACVGVDPFEQ